MSHGLAGVLKSRRPVNSSPRELCIEIGDFSRFIQSPSTQILATFSAVGLEFSTPYPADPCSIPNSAFCQLNRCHLPLLAVYFGSRAFCENFCTCHAQTPKTPPTIPTAPISPTDCRRATKQQID